MNVLIQKILRDLEIELTDEFDQNFTRGAFFDKPWPKRKVNHGRGSLMRVTGRMRRSLRGTVEQNTLRYTSDAPYFSIHNEGGQIPITPQMRKYFWAMYYQNGGGIKGKTPPERALLWRALALTKANKFTIPKRQVVGTHRRVHQIVKKVAGEHIKQYVNAQMH